MLDDEVPERARQRATAAELQRVHCVAHGAAVRRRRAGVVEGGRRVMTQLTSGDRVGGHGHATSGAERR